MDCIFCKIVKGEIPAKKIYENDGALAFLDISPLNAGHALVIPKKHFVKAHEMDEASWKAVAEALGKTSRLLVDRLDIENYNLLQNNGKLAFQAVMHVHFHIIPKTPGAGLKIQGDSQPSDIDEVHRKLTSKQRTLGEVA